jgi:hypothetical protein
MATQLEDEELSGGDDELDTTGLEVEEPEQEEGETEGAEDEGGEPANDDSQDDADEDVISFGGVDIRDEDEPEHIRDLRRAYREQQRRLRELESASAPKPEDIGPEPDMDNYWERDDPQGDFKRDLLAWNNRKQQAATQQAEQRQQQEVLQREWEADVGEMETQRASLKVRDYDAAYDRVTSQLSDAQQSILVQVAKNKAALVYALGKNPDKLEALTKVGNLAKFAGEVARLDMETRVSRKPTTKPEGTVRGSGTFSGKGASDARLARLEAEANRTGDRTALVRYKKELKRA